MTKSLTIASCLALAVSLTACTKETEAPKPRESGAAGMANMPMSLKTKHGAGVGKVVSLNAETGAISIEHGPIEQLGWPGMTMGFMATSAVLAGVAKGDKVSFEIDWDGKTGTVTSIHKSE